MCVCVCVYSIKCHGVLFSSQLEGVSFIEGQHLLSWHGTEDSELHCNLAHAF